MFATKATIDAGRSRIFPGCEIASAAGRRRVRLRVAFLVIVWSLPGVWCAGHLLTHESESDHHALHAEMSSSRQITEVSCDHEHVHSHPEAPLVLATEGAKKLDASMLLTAVLETEGSKATLRAHEGAALRQAARRAATVSGPRAPPTS